MTSPVQVARRDAALWLHLDRPAALNGLSDDPPAALDAGLELVLACDLVAAARSGLPHPEQEFLT
ncbi:hypothetical protein [Pseudonocardia endophytica]|uniref:Enoyl-CoA hydratase n=1 Tax=Pseudonocardia endophytica TaxID=401976 RepID=A0A4R1HUH6_PSEEN|nr:hypothetical protein [Pseudonocardia endophytica]TCK26357.1 hypothetical protein EV378_2190 [Pseudonocardia endophytica]